MAATPSRTDDELPRDVIMEILRRVQAKSLCRFRCVSKLWRSVISDPYFVESHRAFSRAHPTLLMFFTEKDHTETEEYFHKWAFPDLDLYSVQVSNASIPEYHYSVPNPMTGPREFIPREVDGIYCLDFQVRVRIWNPATGESVDIKTVDKRTRRSPSLFFNNYFGFDPVENKHKVLSVWSEFKVPGIMTIAACVLLLGENATWRPLSSSTNHPSGLIENDSICVDGVIFYITYTNEDEVLLMAFHVGSEIFDSIPIVKGALAGTLVEFSGRAALATTWPTQKGSDINVWILEDIGDRVWRRERCSVPSRIEIERMIIHCGTAAGELLFGPDCYGASFHMFLWNVEKNVGRRIDFVGGLHEPIVRRKKDQLRYMGWVDARLQVESLRSIGGR